MFSAVTVGSLLSAWSIEASPVTIGSSFTSVTVMATTDVCISPEGVGCRYRYCRSGGSSSKFELATLVVS